MNERIRELAKQNDLDITIDGMGYGEGDIEGLVKLVVQDAVNVCLAQRDPQNLNYKPSVKFAEAIKQYFGAK